MGVVEKRTVDVGRGLLLRGKREVRGHLCGVMQAESMACSCCSEEAALGNWRFMIDTASLRDPAGVRDSGPPRG